ncbi:MAG: hypothetical protein ABIU07_02035 [Ramlibacter sp.]
MLLTHRNRLITVLVSLCALLFAQSALAGYVCPGSNNPVAVTQMAQAGMPCAESLSGAMDVDQPALCHAHCQADPQAKDNVQPPAPANLAQIGPVLTVAVPAPPGAGRQRSQLAFLQRATGPAISVRHCCFRI